MHVLLRDGIYRNISIETFDLDLVIFIDCDANYFTNISSSELSLGVR